MGTLPQSGSKIRLGRLPSVFVFTFGLLVVLCVLWPRLLFFSVGGSNQTPVSALTLLLLPVVIMASFASSHVARFYAPRFQSLLFSLLFFFLLVFFKYQSALFGQDPRQSVPLVTNALFYSMSLFLVGLVMFTDRRSQIMLPKLLLLAGAVAACLGIYETIRQNSLTVEFSWIFNYGAPQNKAGEVLRSNFYRGGSLRAKSTFMHPLVFGQFVAAATPLIFAVRLKLFGSVTIMRAAMIGVFACAILASNTRSPFLVALVAMFLYWLLGFISAKNIKSVMIPAILFCSVGFLLYSVYGDDIAALLGGRTAEEVASSQTRSIMFDRAFFALSSSPVFGYGEGRSLSVAGILSESGTMTIDSLYLSYLIDNGYLGFSAFVLFVCYVYWLGIRALSEISDKVSAGQFRAIFAFTAALLFGQAVLSITDNMHFVFIGLAFIVAVHAQPKTPTETPNAPRYMNRGLA